MIELQSNQIKLHDRNPPQNQISLYPPTPLLYHNNKFIIDNSNFKHNSPQFNAFLLHLPIPPNCLTPSTQPNQKIT